MNDGTYEDTCSTCTPCPLGKERNTDVGNEDPCVRTGGGSTTDTTTCRSCGVGFYQSIAVAERELFYPDNSKLDKCSTCLDCLPGGDRHSCGGASSGTCFPWSKPTVTSVSGSGKDSGATTGNQPLIIEGYHFGADLKSGRNDIKISYGPKTDIRYVLDNSVQLGNGFQVPCKITEYDSVTKKGTIQCSTMAGVGKDHWLKVQVGVIESNEDGECSVVNGCGVKTSDLFDAHINYARPIVASYTVNGDPADNMITLGNEELVVIGKSKDTDCVVE